MSLSPRDKFRAQRGKAKQRGIDWQLTFEEWLGIWEKSGKFELRGRQSGNYVMARFGDVGPYSVDNVFVEESGKNISDAYNYKPCGGKLNAGKGRGWTLLKRGAKRYQVMARGKHVGSFATQAEAEAAYKGAFAQ